MSYLFDKFPSFEFDGIEIREISEHDAEDFFNYANDPRVKQFLSEDDIPKSIENAREDLLYWKRLFVYKYGLYWAIEDKNSKKTIGTCGYNNWNKTHKRAEISYDLDPNYWGQGIMIRSVKKICDFAFEELKVNRIQATVAYNNEKSINLLKNLGFDCDGLMPQYGVLNDVVHDFYLYSLRRENNERHL